MYFAGQWIVNLNYWGCNQYITQRALGADLQTARKGILFAGFLKLFMPVIVMLPGIAAYVLNKSGHLEVNGMDSAYSSILGFLPEGLKGLSIAALTAAIVASLAGKLNSISTIYTYDIHNKYFKKKKEEPVQSEVLNTLETEMAANADEKKQVWTGRIVAVIAILISLLFTWEDLLGIGGEGGFTFIQKYTGFISPVFCHVHTRYVLEKNNGAAAVAGLITGLVLAIFFNNYAVSVFGNETFLYTAFKTIEKRKGSLPDTIPYQYGLVILLYGIDNGRL
jgi:SSS family solute:Na+ symporter